MTKQFKIITPSSNGMSEQEFSKSQWNCASNIIDLWVSAYGYTEATNLGVRVFLKGEEVSIEEFVAAVNQGYTDWITKKMETHKRIRVLHGSSVANYVWIWVKK